MPYSSNDDLPPSVRAHLPGHAQDIYRRAFNNAWRRYAHTGRQEEIAHRVAWAAVKKRYRKIGDTWIPAERPRERMVLLLALAVMAGLGGTAAAAQSLSPEAAIRAGRNIALTRCIACHVVTPDQPLAPVLGPGIPSFQEIADRPGTTAEALRESMKTARWHTPELPERLLPMSRLSDQERAQVAAFVLSLRKRD